MQKVSRDVTCARCGGPFGAKVYAGQRSIPPSRLCLACWRATGPERATSKRPCPSCGKPSQSKSKGCLTCYHARRRAAVSHCADCGTRIAGSCQRCRTCFFKHASSKNGHTALTLGRLRAQSRINNKQEQAAAELMALMGLS